MKYKWLFTLATGIALGSFVVSTRVEAHTNLPQPAVVAEVAAGVDSASPPAKYGLEDLASIVRGSSGPQIPQSPCSDSLKKTGARPPRLARLPLVGSYFNPGPPIYDLAQAPLFRFGNNSLDRRRALIQLIQAIGRAYDPEEKEFVWHRGVVEEHLKEIQDSEDANWTEELAPKHYGKPLHEITVGDAYLKVCGNVREPIRSALSNPFTALVLKGRAGQAAKSATSRYIRLGVLSVVGMFVAANIYGGIIGTVNQSQEHSMVARSSVVRTWYWVLYHVGLGSDPDPESKDHSLAGMFNHDSEHFQDREKESRAELIYFNNRIHDLAQALERSSARNDLAATERNLRDMCRTLFYYRFFAQSVDGEDARITVENAVKEYGGGRSIQEIRGADLTDD